jgi:mRNA interferase MazF
MSLLHRGDVVALPPSRTAKGHEQKGRRYAVVVQSDAFDWLGTVLVAPTSTSAQPAIFRPEITVQGRRTRVLTDQLTTVDRTRFGRSADRLSGEEIRELETSMSRLLGLF